jgi:hypothetical protein
MALPAAAASPDQSTRLNALIISAQPVGVGAVSQPWIVKGERSGSLTHRDNEKRFVVRAEEKLTAFLELKSAICACSKLS